mgnify:CR=1 FL=1
MNSYSEMFETPETTAELISHLRIIAIEEEER